MASTVLNQYITSGKDSIEGWLARCDAEIFANILTAQKEMNIEGAVAEIGVHHGKSFIPLAISNEGHNCYAIDVFGQQDLNIDESGAGDKAKFKANLTRYHINPDAITIDERMSNDVTAADIEQQVGKVRFFHIDGGHHFDAIINDMKLAHDALRSGGVIAVDDVFRPEWPEVSMGLFAYLNGHDTGLVPFCIGFNKTYLCHRDYAEKYRVSLQRDSFLSIYLTKKYKIQRDEILIFQWYPLPEWRLKRRLINYLLTYHPDLAYFALKKVFRR